MPRTPKSPRPALPTLPPPPALRVGYIPDLSVTHLYLSVVQDLAGESDQLAVWCAVAVYAPYDLARRKSATLQEWLERTRLPVERFKEAWRALVTRELVVPDGVPGMLLRLESLNRARAYADELRSLDSVRAAQQPLDLDDQAQ
jgi:hypothetical protein